MLRFFLIITFFFLTLNSYADVKTKIIQNLKNTKNLDFKFEQNINGKIETGNCIIEYPKKIFCKYDSKNNKILVSNGKSLVIKTKSGSYYRYRIERTPLNYILDKDFIINEIQTLKGRIIDDKFLNFKIIKDGNEINIFFDKKDFFLIGWQTLDIYQNLNITFIHSLKINQKLKKNTFKLPGSD